MRYLLDSNILRAFLTQNPTLIKNISRVHDQLLFIPFIVEAEQMRGRYDAVLKAESHNLLREQERLKVTKELLSDFEIAYLTQDASDEFIKLQNRKNLNKRYADGIIAAIAIANRDIVVTRNTEDFKDLLPAAQLQNWIDRVY
jgi:predicted nucleic acid-binding protein